MYHTTLQFLNSLSLSLSLSLLQGNAVQQKTPRMKARLKSKSSTHPGIVQHLPPQPHSHNPILPPCTGLRLWQFLLKVLVDGKHTAIIRWMSREEGTFRVIDSEALAKLWGLHKNRPFMNYDKMSRAMRYYYHKHLLDKAPKRLCYQFKYHSKWWLQLEEKDPSFKMAATPPSPPGSAPDIGELEL